MRLIIKGDPVDAYLTLLRRGVVECPVVVATTAGETIVEAEVTDVVAARWFCEPPTSPPFPRGALLWYSRLEDFIQRIGDHSVEAR